MIIIKCRYNNCKLGGEVNKDEAVKDGNFYYHEDCYNKKQDKKTCNEIMVNKLNFMSKQVNMILKKVIDDMLVPSDYVLWMVSKIYKDKLTLNTPFGLEHYLKNGHNWKEFDKQKKELQYKLLKKQNIKMETEDEAEINFIPEAVKYVEIFKK